VQYYLINASSSTKLIYVGQAKDILAKIYSKTALSARVVNVLDLGARGLGFKLQWQRCQSSVLGKLFTPIVPVLTKQQDW